MSRAASARLPTVGSLSSTTIASPLGPLRLIGDGHALHGLYTKPGPESKPGAAAHEPADELFAEVRAQLDAYFAGHRTAFDVPLVLSGTPFQRRVWGALREIPYGTTISYGELARRVGQPSAARAVGLANGRNPVSVIVPCHRVIGTDGTLTGYGGGLDRKRRLLELEAAVLGQRARTGLPDGARTAPSVREVRHPDGMGPPSAPRPCA